MFFWRQGAIANAKGNRSNKKETIGYCNTLLQPIGFSQTELEHKTGLVIITIIMIAHNLSRLRSEDTTAKESAVRGRRWGCGTIWYKYIKSEGGSTFMRHSQTTDFCVPQSATASPRHCLLLFILRVLTLRLLGDHVLSDGSQSVQQLALQPGLHDQ